MPPGLVCSLGDTRRLVDLLGSARAKEMLRTGRRVTAEGGNLPGRWPSRRGRSIFCPCTHRQNHGLRQARAREIG